MITGTYWQIHDDTALARLDAAALRLLTKGGCRIEHEGLLALLEGAGCRIAREEKRCFFPENLVRQAVAHLGRPQEETVSLPTGWNPLPRLAHCGSYPHLLDWPSGERRLASKQDILDMARMAHTLEEFTTVGRVLTCADVPPRLEALWTTLALAETTDKKIGQGEIFYPHYIAPLVRMGEILNGVPGDTSLVASCDFFIAPLIFDRTQAECFLEKRRVGLPIVPGTMPISGLSGPVTLAGTVAIAVAELLAGWTLGYVVDPTLPAGGIVCTGSMDFRTAHACFGSPEALLQDLATVQIARRLYGISIYMAVNYTDAKTPGLEAVFQKMLPLAAVALGGPRMIGGDGLLSAGQDYSPVQHLLELEMGCALDRFFGGFEVTEQTLALDLLEAHMRQAGTSFLEDDHTAEHFRAEQWYPRWFDRRPWQDTVAERESEHQMLSRLDAYCKRAIRDYRRPELDEAKLAELRKVVSAAEQDLFSA